MFPFLKTAFDSTAKAERKQLLKELNDVLLNSEDTFFKRTTSNDLWELKKL